MSGRIYTGGNLTAEQIRQTKAYYDSHFIMPIDAEKLIFIIPLMLFGFLLKPVGIAGSIALFILWLINAHNGKVRVYETQVMSWKLYSPKGLAQYLAEGGKL